MHVIPIQSGYEGGFLPIFENEEGSIERDTSWLVGWLVRDDESVVPMTAEGVQPDAVGHQRPNGQIELYGIGEFSNWGDALSAWLDREEES
jgi:hypothetical protein